MDADRPVGIVTRRDLLSALIRSRTKLALRILSVLNPLRPDMR